MAWNLRIAEEDRECVTDMIAAGVTYWARELTEGEWETTGSDHAVAEWEGGRIIQWYERSYSGMLAGLNTWLRANAPKSYLLEYIQQGQREGENGCFDCSMMDSELADALLQVHAFGEIVYG